MRALVLRELLDGKGSSIGKMVGGRGAKGDGSKRGGDVTRRVLGVERGGTGGFE